MDGVYPKQRHISFRPASTMWIALHWFSYLQQLNSTCKCIVYEFGNKKPRGRPRNRWQDEVREDGSIVGGEEWQEKVYDREEWKKLLRMARNHRILHMPMEWMKGMNSTCGDFQYWISPKSVKKQGQCGYKFIYTLKQRMRASGSIFATLILSQKLTPNFIKNWHKVQSLTLCDRQTDRVCV